MVQEICQEVAKKICTRKVSSVNVCKKANAVKFSKADYDIQGGEYEKQGRILRNRLSWQILGSHYNRS
jgi:hypothetical protein